ncbi:contact-dependent growth inhibition system immunity protein [Streptomyces sp. NPDC004393]|uniref:contact-dependent growth inhibition system immunity protein n=1 Tax=Streptomyces sp. NPDC004533 TaxID=3154278 RepID=UPI0033AE11F2
MYGRPCERSGTLDAVIAEIDDLMQVGLFSEEIADDVDLLPHINPPAGHTVEQCLATIRSHLDRIRNGGAYEKSAVPQTDWEWTKQFPETWTLLGAHFNQEFSRFYTSHREALDDHLSLNDEESLNELVKELEYFLSVIQSDAELERAADILGLQVYPPKGVPLRQWLTEMQGSIKDHLRTHAS